MSVPLIIKSASQRVPDLELDCEPDWTIGQVKEQICLSYPTKPLKEHLKLIYGGKLLPDHLHVKSVLNHVQDIHVMHLVCPFPLKDEVKPVETKEAKQTAPTSAPVFPVPAPNLTPSQMNTSFLPSQSYTSNVPSMPPGAYPASDAMQQYVAMQQMYTQFMAQYLAQFNGGYPPTVFQNAAVAQPTDPVPEQPPRPARPAPREDEGVDYLFILSRAVMLFALLYYYSSMQRIVLVMSIFVLIYIYVKLKRESRAEASQSEREEITDAREEGDADTGVMETEGQEELSENSAPPRPSPSVQRDWRASASTIFTLVSAFFSSLIPTDHLPPVDAN